MAGFEDVAILLLVANRELGGKEVAGGPPDHVARAGDTGTVGERLIDRQVLAGGGLHAEHHVRDRGQDVGDRFERPIEHAPVFTVGIDTTCSCPRVG